MENEKTNDEYEPSENIAEKLQNRIDRLEKSIETISSEHETIKLNIQKRKSENTTLKILFYTGLIVLLLGFLYTNSTLQRAQMDSLESSINTLQTLMNREMLSVEKNVYGRIDRLEQKAVENSENNLQQRLDKMLLTISQLNPDDEKLAGLIEQVKKDSMEWSQAYAESRKPSEGEQVNTDGNDPDNIEKEIFKRN